MTYELIHGQSHLIVGKLWRVVWTQLQDQVNDINQDEMKLPERLAHLFRVPSP